MMTGGDSVQSRGRGLCVALALGLASPAAAQTEPQTRADAIRQERGEKVAGTLAGT